MPGVGLTNDFIDVQPQNRYFKNPETIDYCIFKKTTKSMRIGHFVLFLGSLRKLKLKS